MKKIISTDLTPSNIAKVMEIITETPQKLEMLSKPLTVEQLRQPLGQGKRSFTVSGAGVVLGREANGWNEWKYEDGRTLDEVHRQVEITNSQV